MLVWYDNWEIIRGSLRYLKQSITSCMLRSRSSSVSMEEDSLSSSSSLIRSFLTLGSVICSGLFNFGETLISSYSFSGCKCSELAQFFKLRTYGSWGTNISWLLRSGYFSRSSETGSLPIYSTFTRSYTALSARSSGYILVSFRARSNSEHE